VDSLEIASAFSLLPLRWHNASRAKAKIRDAGIPYQVPSLAELPERLNTVLQVIYLVFNRGYAASSGTSLTRTALSESHPFGATGYGLLPAPEVIGLLALMLLQESRRTARTSSTGDLILLEDQNRSLWNLEQISEGRCWCSELSSRQFGSYTLQAAIAAVHSEAPIAGGNGLVKIAALYDVLIQVEPSPIVDLNRAVAIAMRDGAGLQQLTRRAI